MGGWGWCQWLSEFQDILIYHYLQLHTYFISASFDIIILYCCKMKAYLHAWVYWLNSLVNHLNSSKLFSFTQIYYNSLWCFGQYTTSLFSCTVVMCSFLIQLCSTTIYSYNWIKNPTQINMQTCLHNTSHYAMNTCKMHTLVYNLTIKENLRKNYTCTQYFVQAV